MAMPPRTNGGRALRLASWNADGVRGRKLELEQFLIENGVDNLLCKPDAPLVGSGRKVYITMFAT
jgi:hypothetical protein